MKIDAKVTDIRGLLQVGPTTDQHGNPVAVVEILGAQVLFADPRDLPHCDWDIWEETVASQIGAFLGSLLLGTGVMDKWKQGEMSVTGREVWRLGNREDYSDEF